MQRTLGSLPPFSQVVINALDVYLKASGCWCFDDGGAES